MSENESEYLGVSGFNINIPTVIDDEEPSTPVDPQSKQIEELDYLKSFRPADVLLEPSINQPGAEDFTTQNEETDMVLSPLKLSQGNGEDGNIGRNVTTPASNYQPSIHAEENNTADIHNPRMSITREQSALFRHTINLLQLPLDGCVRMISTEPISGVKDPLPGYGAARPFFIHQQKPKPMTPLKVWRGYFGNVYFDPVNICPASPLSRPNTQPHLPPLNHCTQDLQKILLHTRWNKDHVRRINEQRTQLTEHCSEYENQVRQQRNRRITQQSPRTNLILDPKSVHEFNSGPEELRCIRSMQSTGSLRVHHTHEELPFSLPDCPLISQPPISPRNITTGTSGCRRMINTPSTSWDKTRVYRGSVSRKLVELRRNTGGHASAPVSFNRIGSFT